MNCKHVLKPCPECGSADCGIVDLADNGPGRARVAAFDYAATCHACGFTVHGKSLLQSKLEWDAIPRD